MLREFTFEIEIKAVAEDGSFQGVATTYGNIDSVGDRIEAGAFHEDDGKQVPILWSHQRTEPVGLGVLAEDSQGVRIAAQLDLDTTSGREAYSRLKKGIVKALSIGFEALADGFENGVRVIRKGIIREVSLVLFAANERARVTAVKDEQPACAARELLPYCD